MKSILWAGIALAMSISAAGAADSIAMAPAGFVWSGGYVGLQAGYAWGASPFRNRSGDYVEGTDYDPRGFVGGFYAGYNGQLTNNVVLGIDADLNVANIKGDGTAYTWSDNGGSGEYDVNPHAKMRWNGAVRARVGYAYDRFLPYLAGGVSFGEYKFDLTRNNGDVIFSETPTMTGWNIGAGVEYAATDNLILRAEYRYTDFGSKTFQGLWGEDEGKIKLRTHDVRLGIAYKF